MISVLENMLMRGFLKLLLLVALAFGATQAGLAGRNFPENAKRGDLKALDYPQMKIGSQVYRLAPGGKIYDTMNMIVMPDPSKLRAGPILYTIDFNGHVSAVWLLTAEEAAQYPLPPALKK
jgi:hypothetical protein